MSQMKLKRFRFYRRCRLIMMDTRRLIRLQSDDGGRRRQKGKGGEGVRLPSLHPVMSRRREKCVRNQAD